MNFRALEERNITGTFVGLPFGFSTVSISIEGDVGSNTSTHQSELSRTVQRLRPLASALAVHRVFSPTPLMPQGNQQGI